MNEIELTPKGVLCYCIDETWHIFSRMEFLKEIYGCVESDFYDAFLLLIFENMEQFMSTMKKMIDNMELVLEKNE